MQNKTTTICLLCFS